MRKSWLVLLSMMIVAALFIVGCGDDDECPTPTTPTTPPVPATFTNGEMYIYDGTGLYFYNYVYVHGGASVNIDSIIVDTVSTVVNPSYYWNYADPYWYSDYYENEDPSAYASGDDVTVSMYGSGLSSSCNVSLLHYEDDATTVISPEYNANVDTGSTVEVVWDKVDNAEYYAIYTELTWDSAGTTITSYDYTSTEDTTYTVPVHFTDTTVDYFYCYVMPTCGPDPNSYTGNWAGNLTTGVLYSRADYDYTLVWVTPSGGSARKMSGQETLAVPQITSWEIIKGVYGLSR